MDPEALQQTIKSRHRSPETALAKEDSTGCAMPVSKRNFGHKLLTVTVSGVWYKSTRKACTLPHNPCFKLLLYCKSQALQVNGSADTFMRIALGSISPKAIFIRQSGKRIQFVIIIHHRLTAFFVNNPIENTEHT